MDARGVRVRDPRGRHVPCRYRSVNQVRRVPLRGRGLLLFSDLMLGLRLAKVPGCGSLVGPTYIAAELCLLVSFFWTGEKIAGTDGDSPSLVRGGQSLFGYS